MPQLFILDHSLIRPGTHHYTQAIEFAEAAKRRGMMPIVAGHLRFDAGRWPVACEAVPTFRDWAYSGFSVCATRRPDPPLNPLDPELNRAFGRAGASGPMASDGDAMNATARSGLLASLRAGLGDWLRLPITWRHRIRGVRVTRSMIESLERFFAAHPWQDGDQVLMPTVTEFDLVGVTEYLVRNPRAQAIPWHFVFHAPLVIGPWTGDAVQRQRVETMRVYCTRLLGRLREGCVQLHATSDALIKQYRMLDVGPVHFAPAPVTAWPRCELAKREDRSRPLRVLCAGSLREEKSQELLAGVIEDLARDDFFGGRIAIWVQSKKVESLHQVGGERQWYRADPMGQLPPANARLVHVPHPLPVDAFARLMGIADIAMLAYDRSFYASVSSGVMGECLASGIPTVVTAGTTPAAEQLAGAGSPDRVAGLTASTASEFASALRQIAADIDLYRERAAKIAPGFVASHSADAVLDKLLASAHNG